jgi:hypothetical protein
MMKRFLKTLAAVIAVVATTSAAKADFVIDNFTVPAPAVTFGLGTAAGSTYTATNTVGAATRSIYVEQTGVTLFANSTNGIYGTTSLGGVFQLNSPNISTSASWARLSYAYSTAQNLAGSNLVFSFLPLTTSTPFSVVVSNGTSTATQVGTVVGGPTTTTFSLPMSGFGSSSFLSSITSIELYLNRDVLTTAPNGGSVPDTDVTLTNVVIEGAPVVPAPPAVILMLAAAPALGLARFARRKIAG